MFSKRHFVNRFPDYQNEVSPMARGTILDHIRQLKSKILALPLERANCTGGLYTGVAGVGYALWYLSLNADFANEKDQLLQEALKRVNFNLQNVNLDKYTDALRAVKCKEASFVAGDAGMFALGALICREMADSTQMNEFLAKFMQNTLLLEDYLEATKLNADEFIFGRIGVFFGMILLRQHLGTDVVTDSSVMTLLNSTLQSHRNFAQKLKSPLPLANVCFGMEFAGAAHGLASTLQAFLSFPEMLNSLDEKAASEVKTCAEYLLTLQLPDGNFQFLCRPSAFHRKVILGAYFLVMGQMVHWCNGATGLIYFLATAYHRWGDQKYLTACEKAADCVWNQGLLKKGPGICHGTAGSAYAFLIMYRLTKNDKYLYRAHRFAEYMLSDEFKTNAKTPDCPLSLFEGLAGTLCFYLDLLNPEKAQFPAFPVVF